MSLSSTSRHFSHSFFFQWTVIARQKKTVIWLTQSPNKKEMYKNGKEKWSEVPSWLLRRNIKSCCVFSMKPRVTVTMPLSWPRFLCFQTCFLAILEGLNAWEMVAGRYAQLSVISVSSSRAKTCMRREFISSRLEMPFQMHHEMKSNFHVLMRSRQGFSCSKLPKRSAKFLLTVKCWNDGGSQT